MAEVDRNFHGRAFAEGLAYWEPVQGDLHDRATAMERIARSLLAQHRSEGHSFIELEHGDVDYWVILNDTRGQQAAMSIEYGRGPNENGEGAMAPLNILHRATGAVSKGTFPRSRRRKRLT